MMVGRVDSLKRSFEVYGALQRNMRCTAIATVLVLLLLMPAGAAQTSGRDGPNCLERDIGQLLNSVTVDSSVCVKVNLGNLEPGDVYDVSISIINDAIDVLFFDQNQILTYDAGQSYRSQFNQVISTENALGGYDFHWKVPASINPKTWYMVLDNLDHDGDNDQGDLGGSTSQVGVSFTEIVESYWTPYHDVLKVNSDNYATLLSGDDLKLDAGTTVVVTAWALDGEADVYLQTRAMHDLYISGGVGQLFIADLDLKSVADSDSDTWTVPQELDGQELLVIVDNTNYPVARASKTRKNSRYIRNLFMSIEYCQLPDVHALPYQAASSGLPTDSPIQVVENKTSWPELVDTDIATVKDTILGERADIASQLQFVYVPTDGNGNVSVVYTPAENDVVIYTHGATGGSAKTDSLLAPTLF